MDYCLAHNCFKGAHWHHVIHTPAGSRDKASEDGLVIPLCSTHHEESVDSPHRSALTDTLCGMIGQLAWMLNQLATEDEKDELKQKFKERYGKNYL